MMEELPASIERVFNLGEYKSLRVRVTDLIDPDLVRERDMYERTFDAYLQFFIHQKLTEELLGRNSDEWTERIVYLKDLRSAYREQLSSEE